MPGPNAILFVDAYDSFSNNIIALLYSCIPSADIIVVHIDTNIKHDFQLDVKTFLCTFQAIVLGPGPGHPANKPDVGLFEHVWEVAEEQHIPVLGICLGFQSLCIRNGYSVTRMHAPCHGQTKLIKTANLDIFEDLEDIHAMNYNSLAVRKSEFMTNDEESRPSSSGTDSTASSSTSDFLSIKSGSGSRAGRLQLLAWDDDGYVMAVKHMLLPFWGLQFHPESCMSQGCAELVQNWWFKADHYNNFCRVREGSVLISTHPKNSTARLGTQVKEATSTGQVLWQMMKAKHLDPSHISDLCYVSSKQGTKVMLESTAKGRYSIYAFTNNDSEVITYHKGSLTSSLSQQHLMTAESTPKEALNLLEAKVKASACVGGCPKIPFWGGLIGYLSYEMGLDIINVASADSRSIPDFNFVFVDRSVVFDNQTRDLCIQSIRPNDEQWIDNMKLRIKELDKGAKDTIDRIPSPSLTQVLQSARINMPEHRKYTSLIRQCQENLHAGESYELCLTAEATVDLPNPSSDTSYDLYKNLRKRNPVPYASYLDFPSHAGNAKRSPGVTIISSSPELFLSQSRTGTMDMIPMKGTVQRTPNTTIEDAMKVLYTPKETAENLMIADLIRHDLYAVVGTKPYPWFSSSPNPTIPPCYDHTPRRPQLPSHEDNHHSTFPSVPTIAANHCKSDNSLTRSPLSIPALNTIQSYETVYQLTSHIRAHPPPHLSHPATLPTSIISHNHRALHHILPPGSMTGAPKKRSCEILQTLERRNRGVYSGIIGYMDVGGGAAWSVAIRTAFSGGDEEYNAVRDGEQTGEKRRVWHVGAGGAVTVLSDVEAEWEEMMGKMGNVLKGFKV